MSDLEPTSRRRDWLLLLVAMIGYVVLYSLFWPRLPGIMDEVGYINHAELWARGGITAESTGMTLANGWALAKGVQVSHRHPGVSLLLLPIVTITDHTPAVFVLGPVIHLLLALIAARLFVHWRLSPLWALLVLFHPTFLLFSRTVMADGAAATAILIAYVAAVKMKRPHLVMGLALGFATACRMQIAVMVFGAAVWLLLRRDWRGVVVFGIGAALFGLPLAAYNYIRFDSPTGFDFGPGFLSVAHVPSRLPFDLLVLTVIWPLMLPIAALNRRLPHRGLLWLMVIPCLVLVFCYHHRDSTPSLVQTMLVWPRLLQPVIPLLIVAFAHALATGDWLSPVRARLSGAAVAAVFIAGSLAVTFVVFQRHQQHLETLSAAKTAICTSFPAGSRVLLNTNAAKLVGVLDRECGGYRGLIVSDLDPRPGVDEYLRSEIDGVAWYTKAGAGDLPEPIARDLPNRGFVRVESVPGMEMWKKAP